MNKKLFLTTCGFTGLAIGIGGGALYAIFLYNVKRKAFNWKCAELESKRAGEAKEITEAYKIAREKVSAIYDSEKASYDLVTEEIKANYNRALSETGEILKNEDNIVHSRIAEARRTISELNDKISVIESKENAEVEDILKDDSAYRALRTAKKALKKAGKDFSDVTNKMRDRKNAITEQVRSCRTKDACDIFKARDNAIRTAKSEEDIRKSIVNARTEQEKASFNKLDTLTKELYKRRWSKDSNADARSAEDCAAISRYDELREKYIRIEKKERSSIDTYTSVGEYLKNCSVPKGAVLIVGLVPMLIFLYFAFSSVTAYSKALIKVMKGMQNV